MDPHHGVPHSITTGTGTNFQSSLVKFLARFGCRHICTISYHPQHNGMVERWHRHLKNTLRAAADDFSSVNHLPLIMLYFHAALRDDGHPSPASGRGASLSACAGLTNQLLSCLVDPRIAWIKHWHRNCRRPVVGCGGTPRPVLLPGAKKSHLPDQLRSIYGLSEFHCH